MKDKKELQDESLDLDLEQFDFDEEVEDEEDYDFNQGKSKTKLILMIAIPLVVILAVWFFFFRSTLMTPDMTNWSRFEVDNWASENEVEIMYSYEYSDTAENFVIAQSVPFGTKVKNGLQITVTVSEGLDPNELVNVIDIENSTDTEIQSWVEANGLKNVELKYAYNPLVPEDHVISYEFNTGSEIDFKRKDNLVVEISRGTVSNVDKVTLPDFTKITLGEALAWGEINGMTLNTNYVFSEYSSVDKVMKQDVVAGEKVTSSDIINLTVSKGRQIVVPNFDGLTKAKALTWAENNGVDMTINEEYSSQLMNGYYINQSIPENDVISVKDELTLTYSLGKIDIFSFKGQPILNMKNAMDDLNLEGANITYNIEEVFSTDFANGMIVSHSYEYEEMNPGAIMTIIVSKGESVFVPDFKGMTQDLILDECSDLGMVCVFQFRHYPSPEGWVISQSIDDGEVISKNDPVTITLSLGPS